MRKIRKEGRGLGTCVVMPVYHREDTTLSALRQLVKVTPHFRLIVVDNGFDRQKELLRFKPWRYVENERNRGAIRAINQGLALATGKYVAVIHNDLLIYERGWLEHALAFMEENPTAGIVGLAGRHRVNADGSLDLESTVVNMRGYPPSMRPSWRFTEVAVVDGLGWVMRNLGFRLDERYGLMHYYDLDLSMQFIAAGFSVHVMGVEVYHVAEEGGRSTRSREDYLSEIGGDDSEYYERAREMFRKKWKAYLPIERGLRDEAYFNNRVEELRREIEAYRELLAEVEGYVRKLENEIKARDGELGRAKAYVAKLEAECRKLTGQLD